MQATITDNITDRGSVPLTATTFAGLEKNNCFDFLRFVAATMVIFSHCYPLTGRAADPLARAGGDNLGTVGVCMFFTLSGFLISRSWLSNPSLPAYTIARCLRIFPALVFSLLVTVFAIGPAVTSLAPAAYFSNPQTWDFLLNTFLFPIRYNLPGVFTGNPLAGAVNGSLWSLPVEFLMYGVIVLTGLAGLLKRKWLLLVSVAALVACDVCFFSQPDMAKRVELTVLVGPAMNCAIYFMVGAVFYSFRDRVPARWWFAVAAMALFALSLKTPALRTVSYAALPYLFFYVSRLPVSFLRQFGKSGDFSYGLYVFGFPVQQSVVHFWGHNHPLLHVFALSFAVSLALAFVSWHAVENPCLNLKKLIRTRMNPERAKQ